MKKKLRIVTGCIAMCAAVLTGCGGSLDVEVSTIALQKNGKITETSIEDFSASYYDEDELAAYIEEAVDEYVEENGKGTVKVSSSLVEESEAYLTIKYDSSDTYADFTGEECFSGDLLEAQAAGYDFDTEFYAVSDGETASETVSSETVLEDEELSVFIVRTNAAVQVPGTILYASADSSEITSSDTVSYVSDGENEDEMRLVYIVYE